MKKMLLVATLLLIPLFVFSGITVNWLPQAGISYTWKVTPWNGDFWDSGMVFSPGFSGGVAAEIKFSGWFGLKAGLDIGQVVTHYKAPAGGILTTPIYDSVTGVTITALPSNTSSNEVTVQVPVLAMFYAGVTAYLELYCGLGAAPGFITWRIIDDFDNNGTRVSSDSRYVGSYMTGFAADLGMHWAAGPGKVTAGFVYTFTPRQQVSSHSTVTWYGNNLKFYAGYLF